MGQNIENIVEINNTLNIFRDVKTDIHAALLEKTNKDAGPDMTKYAQAIKDIELGGAIEITGTKQLTGFITHPGIFNGKYNIHDITFDRPILNLIEAPSEYQNIEPIVLDFYKNKISFIPGATNQYFYCSQGDQVYNVINTNLKRFFRLRNIPTTNAGRLFRLVDVNNSKINVELDDDYLNLNQTFNLGSLFVMCRTDITEIPDFLFKLLPLANSIQGINYDASYGSAKFALDGKEVTFELAKLGNTNWSYTGRNFANFTADTVNVILHNNVVYNGIYGLFCYNSNIKNLNIVGGNNNGFWRPNVNNAVIITSDSYVENLKINLQTYNTSNVFSFKNVTNSVELVQGSEFGTIKDLPFTTREGWVQFFTKLGDNSKSNYQNKIDIGTDYYNLLTEEDKLIALDKGYTLATV